MTFLLLRDLGWLLQSLKLTNQENAESATPSETYIQFILSLCSLQLQGATCCSHMAPQLTSN